MALSLPHLPCADEVRGGCDCCCLALFARLTLFGESEQNDRKMIGTSQGIRLGEYMHMTIT